MLFVVAEYSLILTPNLAMIRNNGDEEMKEDVAGKQDPSKLSLITLSFLDLMIDVVRDNAYKVFFDDDIMDAERNQNNYFNGLDDLLDDEFQIMK